MIVIMNESVQEPLTISCYRTVRVNRDSWTIVSLPFFVYFDMTTDDVWIPASVKLLINNEHIMENKGVLR